MSRPQDTEYECTLDAETLDKARRELGETEETRMLEVDNLRKRVQKVPGLQARTDTKFLLRFLRVRKFNQERAFESVKHFYELKSKHPEVFEDLKPSRVKHMFDYKYNEILKGTNKDRCKVLIWRSGNWDEKRYSVMEVLKAFTVLLLKIQEEEETQIHGIHFIVDMTGVHLGHIVHWTLPLLRLASSIFQTMIPLRIKRVDYIHVPNVFYKIYPLVKQVTRDKLFQRICINDDSFEGLHSMIDPEHLPTYCGGVLEPDSDTEFLDALMSSDQQFEEDNKFGYVTMVLQNDKKETSKEDAGLQGLGGTFKKLEV